MLNRCYFLPFSVKKRKKKSQTLKIQGRGWFKGILEISKAQVKDDITRVVKDVGLGFIIFGTPRRKSQKR